MDNKCTNNNPKLFYNEACLRIQNLLDEDLEVFWKSVECEGCRMKSLGNISGCTNVSFLLDVFYPIELNYNYKHLDCYWEEDFKGTYEYGWILAKNCSKPFVAKVGSNKYLPILVLFLLLFLLSALWFGTKCILRSKKFGDGTKVIKLTADSNRLKSVDVFRGLCVMLMIIVNYHGGLYKFFKHSLWNGLALADLIFPFFLWIIGFSMMLSFNKKLENPIPRWLLVLHVIRRSFILCLIGLIVTSNKIMRDFGNLPFCEVLQRIAASYLIVGIMEACLASRSIEQPPNACFIVEVTIAWAQWLIMSVAVGIYLYITFQVKIPGCPKGYSGPGGMHLEGKYKNCTGGIGGYIDRYLLGRHRMDYYVLKPIYDNTLSFDPSGPFGTFMSALMVFLGVHAGRVYLHYNNNRVRIIRWTLSGLFFGSLGSFLCGFSKSDGLIPINRISFSLSLVLVCAGLASYVLSGIYFCVDVLKLWNGEPLYQVGMNAMTLYVLHKMLYNTFPIFWTPSEKTHAVYLSILTWSVSLFLAFAIFLHKRKIFITI